MNVNALTDTGDPTENQSNNRRMGLTAWYWQVLDMDLNRS